MKQIIGFIDVNNVNRNVPMLMINKFAADLGIRSIGLKKKGLNIIIFYKEVK